MRYNHVSRIIIITVLSYFKNTGISLSCILFFSIKCALIKMIDSEIPSSLFCLRGSRTNRTLVRATGEDHSFADNFSAAEIILLAKMGKQKLLHAIFSVRCSRRFFRDHKSGPKNAVNFLDHDGAKKGCNPSSPQERFTFVRHAVVSKVQKRYSLTKSNRNAPRNPDFGL